MYCNNCGQFIDPGNSKCSYCGTPINDELNNVNYDGGLKKSLDEKDKKNPIIFAACSLISFILGIVAKNIPFLSLILLLLSFVLSEIGIKQSKKYNSKLWKIINSILGVISILYFFLKCNFYNIFQIDCFRNHYHLIYQ